MIPKDSVLPAPSPLGGSSRITPVKRASVRQSTWPYSRQTVEVGSGGVGSCNRRCAISNQMASDEDLKIEIERLRAENEALKKPARGQMSLKVSEKGGLSVYGLGRFPVTLYKEQWVRLLAMADEIRNFIRENDSVLKTKE